MMKITLVTILVLSAVAGGFIISYYSLVVPAIIIMGIALVVLLYRPELMLGIFLAAMFVWTFLPSTLYDILKGFFVPLTVGIASGIIIIRYGIKLKRFNAFDVALLVFSFYLYVALFWSPAPTYGFFKATSFFLGSTFLYFVVVWAYHQRPRALWWLVIIVALLGLLPVFFTVIASLNVGFDVDARTARTYYLTYVMGWDVYGLSNSLQLAGICSFALYQRQRQCSDRWLWIIIFIATFWALLALSTRAQILGVAVACAILVAANGLFQKRYSSLRIFTGIGIMLALIVIAFVGAYKFNPAYIVQDENVFTRFDLYESAWSEFADSPLWGSGTGSFSFSIFGIDVRIFSHNIFLDILAEGGLVGLLLFMGVLCTLVVLYVRRLPKNTDSFSLLGWLGLALCASRLVVGMFSADLSSLNLGPWLAMLAIGASTPDFASISNQRPLQRTRHQYETTGFVRSA